MGVANVTSQAERIQAVCPACRRAIGFPAGRVDDRPRCPACKVDVLDGRAVDLNELDFDAFVAHGDLPLLVDFWAPWCGPCRTFAPTLERLAAEMRARLVVARVDTEAAPRLSARYAIRSIPTLALFQHGQEVARSTGAMPADALRDWLAAHGVHPRQPH
jgi:thioredoxin 2